MRILAANALTVPKTAFDPLSLWTKMYYPLAIADRFGYLNHFSPWDLAADPNMPRPKREFKYDNFGDIMDKRAVEYIEAGKGKPLCVHWSGGVDSTALLVSLLKHVEKPSDITVIFTPESVQEYIWFYAKVLKDSGCNLVEFDPDVTKITDIYKRYANGFYTVGWCADQLFGSNLNQRYPEKSFIDWEKGFREHYPNINTRYLDRAVGVYKQYFEKMDVDITTFSEFAWLGNFCLKFSYLYYHIPMLMEDPNTRKNVFMFFADPDMQDWALAHYKENCSHHQKYDIVNYKKPLKDYIIDYTGDDSFLYKGKKGSWAASMEAEKVERFVVVDSEVGFRAWRLKKATACNTCYLNYKDFRPVLEDYARYDWVFSGGA